MIFRTVPENIPQIVRAVNHFGGCMFHGDGNIYNPDPKEGYKNSDDRQKYSNPKDEEAKYRIEFKRGDVIPSNVEQLNKMLLEAKNREVMAERTTEVHSHVTTIPA